MRCRGNAAMVVPRPRRLLRTRSRICAVSISKDYVRAGRACFKGRHCAFNAAPVVCGHRLIRTRAKQLATGATRGGIPFGRGALYYLLSNYFYIGEGKYKNEILPGEQPPIMDRALFEAIRQKSLAQWSHRTIVRP